MPVIANAIQAQPHYVCKVNEVCVSAATALEWGRHLLEGPQQGAGVPGHPPDSLVGTWLQPQAEAEAAAVRGEVASSGVEAGVGVHPLAATAGALHW